MADKLGAEHAKAGVLATFRKSMRSLNATEYEQVHPDPCCIFHKQSQLFILQQKMVEQAFGPGEEGLSQTQRLQLKSVVNAKEEL